ncbi:MAG: DUF2314 domain-containing protein [bacterium]|jgi:uncharacterized protein YegJ (DUF2314 family)|nr:DUF2314 domain-containing protein [Phycisphaerales bacterium]MCE2653369.1 DUF2314 domain-containing protein [Planctomycetaceae bacterium]
MWWNIGGGVVVVVLAVVAVLVIRARRARSAGPLSIVMLRATQRRLTEAQVRSAARRHGGGLEVHVMPMDGESIGLQGQVLIVGRCEMGAVTILDVEVPYLPPEERERQAAKAAHRLVRRAISEHGAWMGVDLVAQRPLRTLGDRLAGYAVLLPLARELDDEQTLAMYLPADGRFAPPGEAGFAWLEQSIAAGRLLEMPEHLEARMMYVEEDDKEIVAAKAEAKRRLPELLRAWEERGTDSNAMVKACFAVPDDSDVAEFMWVKVTAIEGWQVTGTLENPPTDERLPEKGSVVSVNLDEVVDWACLTEKDKAVGLFVERILMKRR